MLFDCVSCCVFTLFLDLNLLASNRFYLSPRSFQDHSATKDASCGGCATSDTALLESGDEKTHLATGKSSSSD